MTNPTLSEDNTELRQALALIAMAPDDASVDTLRRIAWRTLNATKPKPKPKPKPYPKQASDQ